MYKVSELFEEGIDVVWSEDLGSNEGEWQLHEDPKERLISLGTMFATRGSWHRY